MKHRRRRGLHVVLWMLGSFLTAQFLGGILLDNLCPRVRFEMLFQHIEHMKVLPQTPTVICLGSSRFGCGLNAETITARLQGSTAGTRQQVYNASVPAGDFASVEMTLDRLLAEGFQPRYAIIEICPELVSRRNDWIKFDIMRELHWSEVPRCLPEITRTGNLLRLIAVRGFPLVFFRQGICDELCRSADHCLCRIRGIPEPTSGPPPAFDWSAMVRQGLMNPDLEPAAQTQIGLHAVSRFLRNYAPGGNSVLALHRVLKRCRLSGIEPILLVPPVAEDHRALYTPEIERNYRWFIEQLLAEHHVHYLDCRAVLPDRLFIDNHHASAEGGAVFSRKVASELLIPLCRNGTLPPEIAWSHLSGTKGMR